VSAFADDVAGLLEAVGVGVVGTTIFVGRMPESPDYCIALVEYMGEAPDFTQGGGMAYELPRVQISVRGTSEAGGYDTAYDAARTIFKEVAKVTNTVLGTTFYQRLRPLQSPFVLQRDENDRVVFVVNVECHRTID
jgi:hypothetical protein